MIKKLLDWTGYLGVAVLAAAALLPFMRPEWGRARGTLVIVGLLLVLASLLGYVKDVRGVLRRRTTRYGFNSVVMVALLLAIIGFVEAVSYRHSARLDLTENKRNSLSPQTIQLLRGLKADINAVAFFRGDQPGKRVAEDLFKQYARYAGGKFTWKVVDPDREPGLARRYGIEAYGTVVLETKERSEKVTDAEEEKLTNGLVKLTRQGKRVVYIVQGHGEHEVTNTERPGFSEAKTALEKANYEVKPLVLARQTQIPDDAGVVVLAGPRTELLAPELSVLDAYVGRGGKLFVMADPVILNASPADPLKAYLEQYGFSLGNDLIIELNPIGRLFGIGPEVPIIQQYEPHAITREMGGVTTLFPLARSVAAAKTPPAGLNVQMLAKTSPDSWAETNRTELQQGQVKPEPGEARGPLAVAAVATKDKARIVVYGTSNLAANQFINLQGNRDFFLNTVSWLAEEEDQISIRPKDTKQSPVFLNSQQAQAVFLLPVVVLPGLVLIGGIVTVVRRRSGK